MPLFDETQNNYFGSTLGAYSVVTHREATGDKSVTVDRNEKEVIYHAYPAGSFSRGSEDQNHYKTFHIFDPNDHSHAEASLAIKHPKSEGEELRLYFSRQANFYPKEGEIAAIFMRPGHSEPFVAVFDRGVFENLFSEDQKVVDYQNALLLDEEDDYYQKEVSSPGAPVPPDSPTTPKAAVTKKTTGYHRDPNVGKYALTTASHACEYDSTHKTFTSIATGNPFTEAHHFVPLSLQAKFEVNLDVIENVISLCPNCHRAMHFASADEKQRLIEFFYHKRVDALKSAGINVTEEEVCKIYGV